VSRIALQVSYDGTSYAGFQIQNNATTVASMLMDALYALYDRRIDIVAAGRTDTGVHARAQFIHFDPPNARIQTQRLGAALNTYLPEDIRIIHSYDVSDAFHARFSALKRTYVYTLYRDRLVPPMARHFAVPWLQEYNLVRMQNDATRLIGTHDFFSFAKYDPEMATVRTVYRASFCNSGEFLLFTITANGFLRRMVRSIVGTLCEWEKKRLRGGNPLSIADIIAHRDRSEVGRTAPARGLCLHAIEYEEIDTKASD